MSEEFRMKIQTTGKDGKKSNVESLITVLALLASPGSINEIKIYHDDNCPCSDGGHGITHCICDEVEVGLPIFTNRKDRQ